jgi:hypothetical protein
MQKTSKKTKETKTKKLSGSSEDATKKGNQLAGSPQQDYAEMQLTHNLKKVTVQAG